jgi:hypothetical protein
MAAGKSPGPGPRPQDASRRRKEKVRAQPSRGQRPAPEDIRNYKQSLALANKLNKVAPDEDNAVVAGAIVLFATEVIKRSSSNVLEARAYLEGMRSAIDGFLANAFQEKAPATGEVKVRRRRG